MTLSGHAQPTHRRKLARWKVWNKPRIKTLMLITKGRAEFLLSNPMADAETSDAWAQPLARWLLNRPEKIPLLQPNGRFHRKVLMQVLNHPRMTPVLRNSLAKYDHLLEYML